MGRKAKYGTLNVYQPFIDAIRKDLGIPETMFIKVTFANLRSRRNGDATYFSNNYSEIRVSKFLPHIDILRVLGHEFRHIWQFVSGTMVVKPVKAKRGYTYKRVWNSVEYDDFGSKTRTHYNQYYNSPWEVDARQYGEQHKRLFPNGAIPPKRKLLGKVGGVTFYKIVS